MLVMLDILLGNSEKVLADARDDVPFAWQRLDGFQLMLMMLCLLPGERLQRSQLMLMMRCLLPGNGWKGSS